MRKYINAVLNCKPIYCILVIGYLFIHISSNTLWGNKNYEGIIETDGVGYYSYLPAIFIYQDPSFQFLDSVSDHFAQSAKGQIQTRAGNTFTNKYFIGTSILQLPFFGIAHGLTLLNDGIADGYSKIYQIMMSLCGIFYTLLGLYFMAKILMQYRIPFAYINFILLALAWGTSILVYAVFEPTMSHVYSFYLINHLLYLFLLQKEKYHSIRNVGIAILLGLIVLVRPVNIIIILSLFWIFETRLSLLEYIKKTCRDIPYFALSILLFIALVAIQPLWYYISTGHAFVYSYREEGFNWGHPEFINYLFSFKKGLFIYTPLCFVGLLSGLFIYKKNYYLLISWLLFVIALIYMLCSWWCWWYGGSFGQRSMIEFYFAFFIPLAIVLTQLEGWYRKGILTLIAMGILICQIQIYQYRYYYIHYTDMDWKKYKKVFLRVDYIIKEIPAGEVYKQ